MMYTRLFLFSTMWKIQMNCPKRTMAAVIRKGSFNFSFIKTFSVTESILIEEFNYRNILNKAIKMTSFHITVYVSYSDSASLCLLMHLIIVPVPVFSNTNLNFTNYRGMCLLHCIRVDRKQI